MRKFIRSIKFKLKCYKQYFLNGFSDREVFDLGPTWLVCLEDKVKRYKELLEESPMHPSVITYAEWLDILDKIALASRLYKEDDWSDDKRIDEGLALYTKWCRHLWL